MSERIMVGDQESCPSSWVVTTDGTSAEKRAGPSPVALSPDLRKVLLLIGDGELAIANPDGTEQTKIANIPKARSTPVW